jgi:hypothetical protein
MSASPYPIPRNTRETAALAGDGTPGPYGPTAFKVFDIEDVKVWLKREDESAWADVTADCTVEKSSSDPLATVSVTFDDDVETGDRFIVQGARRHERAVSVFKAGALAAAELERELSKEAAALSELRRDVDRALRLPPGATAGGELPEPADGRGPVWSASEQRYVNGPDAAEIADAQGFAEAALALKNQTEQLRDDTSGLKDETAALTALADAAKDTAEAAALEAAAAAAAAPQRFMPVRLVDSGGGNPATAYEAGDTLDGLVLATGDLVLRATPGGDAGDGVWVVPAAGAAARHVLYAAYDAFPRATFPVKAGTHAGKTFSCVSAAGGTIGVTALSFRVQLPAVTANTIMVDNAGGTDREAKTFPQVRPLLKLSYYDAVLEGGCDNTGATNTAAAAQAAIDAATAAGRTCFFPAGTYKLEGTRILVPSNARILGEGPYVSLFTRDADTNQGTIEVYAASRVHIEGIGISYSPATYTLGYAQTGFAVRNGSFDVQIVNCGVVGKINRQYHVLNSHRVRIAGCYGAGGGNAALRVVCDLDAFGFPGVTDELAPEPVNNVWIENCVFTGATSIDGTTRAGTSYGINVATGGTDAGDWLERIFITGNVVRYTESQGIEVSGKGRMIHVLGNHVSNVDDGAGSGIGILLQIAGGLYPLGTLCTGNTVDGCVYGIGNFGSSYQTMVGNAVYNCTTGIYQGGGDYCVISGNLAIACTTGILVTSSATHIGVIGNQAIGGGDGIFVASGTDYVSVVANTAKANSTANYTSSGSNMTLGNNT